MKKDKVLNILVSILLIVLGALLFTTKSQIVKILIEAVGFILIGYGLIRLLLFNMQYGIALIIIGLILMIFGWLLTKVVIAVIGFLVLLYGIYLLIALLNTHARGFTIGQTIIYYSIPVITIIIGFLLFFATGSAIDTIIMIIGILIMIDGVFNLVKALQ